MRIPMEFSIEANLAIDDTFVILGITSAEEIDKVIKEAVDASVKVLHELMADEKVQNKISTNALGGIWFEYDLHGIYVFVYDLVEEYPSIIVTNDSVTMEEIKFLYPNDALQD